MEQESDQFERRLFALSVQAFDSEVSGEDWQELEALLTSSPQACARWQVFMQFHADLRTLSAISRAERSVQTLFAADSQHWADSPPASDTQRKPLRSAPSLPTQPHSARVRTAGLLATLAAAVAIALAAHWWSSPPSSNHPSAANSNGYPVLAPSHLQLAAGGAHYYLPGVGELVVEGPAEFELLDPKSLRLDRGCLRLAVREASGHGFAVATSQGVVTDLGTEFAVDALEDNVVNLVVFDGAVELAVPQSNGPPIVERFEAGEGVSMSGQGERSRIMQVFTGEGTTFRRLGDHRRARRSPLVSVSDNLPVRGTKRFYEVVSGGLREDALAYVDRPYQWNGLSEAGMPAFLRTSDYVKTFNDFKQQDYEITIGLSGACKVVVLWDERAPYPSWLRQEFRKRDALVGLDEGPFGQKSDPKATELGVGPGRSIDRTFSLWVQEVHQPGQVVLGSLGPTSLGVSMYGIAVVP